MKAVAIFQIDPEKGTSRGTFLRLDEDGDGIDFESPIGPSGFAKRDAEGKIDPSGRPQRPGSSVVPRSVIKVQWKPPGNPGDPVRLARGSGRQPRADVDPLVPSGRRTIVPPTGAAAGIPVNAETVPQSAPSGVR